MNREIKARSTASGSKASLARTPAEPLQSSLSNRGVAQLLRTPAATAPAPAPSSSAAPAAGGSKVYMSIQVVSHAGYGAEATTTKEKLTGERPDGKIEVSGYHMGGRAPIDAGTGQARGRRQYQAVQFKKAIDGASPLLFKAFTENQELEVTFEFARPNAQGSESIYQ